jgi:hypothetical protein
LNCIGLPREELPCNRQTCDVRYSIHQYQRIGRGD